METHFKLYSYHPYSEEILLIGTYSTDLKDGGQLTVITKGNAMEFVLYKGEKYNEFLVPINST